MLAINVLHDKAAGNDVVDNVGDVLAYDFSFRLVGNQIVVEKISEHVPGNLIAAGIAFPQPFTVAGMPPTLFHALFPWRMHIIIRPLLFSPGDVGIGHSFPGTGNDRAGNKAGRFRYGL